ncbi:MAG: hypothetical protein H6Q33_5177, partial [Deltaproteobacteria bacterium]|nr:hypothetical protein [Deltaproteobacteria bacterium]
MPRGLLAIVGAISVLSVMLALGGCSVGPKFVKPEATVNE